MIKQRAHYLLHHGDGFGGLRYAFHRKSSPGFPGSLFPDGITQEEHQELLTKWQSMPGHTCYNDVLLRVAFGDPV